MSCPASFHPLVPKDQRIQSRLFIDSSFGLVYGLAGMFSHHFTVVFLFIWFLAIIIDHINWINESQVYSWIHLVYIYRTLIVFQILNCFIM